MTEKGIPLGFVELDPKTVTKLLAGFDDELSGELIKAEALYRQHADCPRGCGRTMQKHGASASFAFGDSNWLIPRCLMKCCHCGCVLNPFDGMLVSLGDPDTANAGGVLLKPTP